LLVRGRSSATARFAKSSPFPEEAPAECIGRGFCIWRCSRFVSSGGSYVPESTERVTLRRDSSEQAALLLSPISHKSARARRSARTIGECSAGCCFHFGFQPSVTQQHLGAPPEGPLSRNRLFEVLLDALGCRLWRTENPRVGGSIPPLATILIRRFVSSACAAMRSWAAFSNGTCGAPRPAASNALSRPAFAERERADQLFSAT
jgi:hypothetical protein